MCIMTESHVRGYRAIAGPGRYYITEHGGEIRYLTARHVRAEDLSKLKVLYAINIQPSAKERARRAQQAQQTYPQYDKMTLKRGGGNAREPN